MTYGCVDRNSVPISVGCTVRYAGGPWGGNYDLIRNMTGTVIGLSNDVLTVHISWHGLSTGHSCSGLLNDRSGWNLSPANVEVVREAQEQEQIVPPDPDGAFWL